MAALAVGTGAAQKTDADVIDRFAIEAGPRAYTAQAETDAATPLTTRIVVDLQAAYPRESFRKVERWWSDSEVPAGPARSALTVPEPEAAKLCDRYGRCKLVAAVRTFSEGSTVDRASDRHKLKVGAERYSGRPVLVPGSTRRTGSGRSYRYGIYVEGGIRIDREAFARQVDDILSSRRGWTAGGAVSFRRVPEGRGANMRIILASGDLVDRLCFPLPTEGRVSCRNGDDVVLNLDRWRRGSGDFATTAAYRQYLVNHEVGHRIGQSHRYCSRPGRRADVMQQQTTSSAPCRPGSWPRPAELADTAQRTRR